ncbi:MAG: pentapeptide repeat-containing protein [Moorea sp. SIO4G2]|uniref:pentapeptide repeat-containing protein n=1 Tax=unclassified Moorena TaxID=2683338 RepID=UPI0013CD7AB2|nr:MULTISPECIES: pentapeptide repeat-containing protein [unclassified Moorena]NEO21596.1 pentapeptide repeat-containing protein [Moorena sp. SIO4A5]NEO63633.1 pentapeptide repeat-containing protein [Moorena sp. SIO4G2]NEQ61850.1 pentapeptide repeat-containing protein [Moorena sp. SIO4A1]
MPVPPRCPFYRCDPRARGIARALGGAHLLLKPDDRAFIRRFSNANLRGVNLSSLNLSHADLSDTDLRDAKLSGADLSGADLSGADLSGASLISANLSHANLSNAQVTGTRFGKNPGLVEQTKDNLIKGGGIWEPSITEVLLALIELN